MFMKLIAPHISAADFSPLSAVLSDSSSLDTFLDLSAVSSMYEPLVALGEDTSLMMEPGSKLLEAQLQCAGHWDEVEKNTDVSDDYKTSADFIGYIEAGTGYAGWYPACPASFFKKRIHMGYETDEDGGKKTLWRDIDRTSTANCQICAYVNSLSAGYDNRPALSAIEFRDNLWMRQRESLGTRD